MIVNNALSTFCVVMLTCMVCYADAPSKEEVANANAVVSDVLAPKIEEMKSGKAKPNEVADYALSLMGEAETPAAKYALAGNAYAYYMKGGEYAKAAEAIGKMREAIPDIPPDRLLKAISPAAKGVSANKAPEVHAILADLQGKVQSQGEITKLAAQIKGAKVSERPMLYRKLGESYAVIGDWKQALENLSKGDGDVAKVAQDEMGNAKSIGKLAGMWWEASEEKGVKPAVASAYRQHAAELYKKGLEDGSISGLNKTLAEQRIKSSNAAVDSSGASEDRRELYCVIDLSSGPESKKYPVSYLSKPPLGGWGRSYKTTKLVLRRIEPGEVKIQAKWKATITKPYYIGVYEVTRKQWELVKGALKDKADETLPMADVTYGMLRSEDWPDSKTPRAERSFIRLLQERTGLDFDLPTEAQWELAARAGDKGDKPKGDMNKFARSKDNGSKPENVGSFKPNAWGLYDMLGNVWEWCADREYWNKHSDGAVDPVGSHTSGRDARNAIVKGGSCKNSAEGMTYGKTVGWGRGNRAYDVGFRVCLNIIPWDGWQNPRKEK